MNRNRNTSDPLSKQSSITSISSNVPLMATNSDSQYSAHLLANTATDVQSFLDSLKTNTNRDSKRGRTIVQPKGTVSYTIGNTDTLEKIALRYNLTPNELLHLNKLSTRIVFPGQTIFVPDGSVPDVMSAQSPPPAKPKEEQQQPPVHDSASNQHDASSMLWSMARQTNAKPGHVQRLKSDASSEGESSRSIEERLRTHKEDNHRQVEHIQKSLSIDENQQLDDECLQRFIKVNVRLMTDDHKTVAGTILVTPNAVMFDPDVLDPLVKEHGIDKYGLIIRMDLLAGIALFEDIAMYEYEATLREEEKRKLCHSTSIKNLQPIVSNSDDKQVQEVVNSLVEKVDRDLNPSTNDDDTSSSFVLFNASSSRQRISSADIHDDLFQSFEDSKHSKGILVDENELQTDRFFSKEYKLENCIPIDSKSNYVTPHSIEIPYYLCIKTSSITNTMAVNQERLSRKHIDNIYGKKDLDQEYWFSVPKDKSDHLYAFFLRWSPDRSLDPLNDDEPKQLPSSPTKTNDVSTAKGFVLLANDDPELTDDFKLKQNNNTNVNNNSSSSNSDSTANPTTSDGKKQHYLKRQNTLLKEWEIINVDEIYRRINATHPSPTSTVDFGIPPPKLLSPSTIINENQSKQILLELPARLHGVSWKMVFSTEANGFSLNQLYRRSMENDQDTPALIFVKDVDQNIFGGYISQQLLVSEGFYGTGESFLFTIHPKFEVFHWTGNNQFFVKGDAKFLAIGSGGGTYGLWLDADLYHGRTCPSKTFNNVRLSTKEDFIIANVEVWTFVD